MKSFVFSRNRTCRSRAKIFLTKNGRSASLDIWNEHKHFIFYFASAIKRNTIVCYIGIVSFTHHALPKCWHFNSISIRGRKKLNPFFLPLHTNPNTRTHPFHIVLNLSHAELSSGFDNIAQRLLIMDTRCVRAECEEWRETACTIKHHHRMGIAVELFEKK